VKRLCVLALLVACGWAAAAPAPLSKPQRKAERPATERFVIIEVGTIDAVIVANLNLNAAPPLGALPPPPPPAPVQPPNADPPG
jgi:hypothetical protein